MCSRNAKLFPSLGRRISLELQHKRALGCVDDSISTTANRESNCESGDTDTHRGRVCESTGRLPRVARWKPIATPETKLAHFALAPYLMSSCRHDRMTR